MTKRPITNRRKFIKTSATVSAGSAAVLMTGRGVHSQESSSGDSANSQANAAVIGTGGRGGSHIEEFLRSSRTVISHICDVDAGYADKRASQIEEKQGKRPKIVTDMREIFDDKSVEVVSMATPNHWHALGGIWAMQAGKDAYIEKPVCHNIAEGTALIATARKYNRMCQVGTQCRSSPAIIDGMKFIADGGIGECNFARGLCYKRRKSIGALGDYDIPKEVNFDLWSGPARFTDPKLTRSRFHYDWHWQRLYGNGDSGNQGPHQTDVARWGLGIDSHPVAVLSYGGRLGYQAEQKDDNYVDAGDTPNTQISIYDYGDKCIVFETRGLSVDDHDSDEELNRIFDSRKGNKIGVVFYGSEGYLVQRTYGNCVAYDKNLNVIKEFSGGGNNEDHFNNFLDACEKRDASILNADVREGHLSAGISHLGNICLALGESNLVSPEELKSEIAKVKSLDDNVATAERTIAHLKQNGVDLGKYKISMGPNLAFDPEKEVFENADANKLVTREYREGYVCPNAADV